MRILAIFLVVCLFCPIIISADEACAEIFKYETNTVSAADISKYTGDETYRIDQTINTAYGTVLYLSRIGMPHGPNPMLKLIRADGEEFDLSEPVPFETVQYRKPMHNDIQLSEDGKYLTFSVSFSDRLVYAPGNTQQVFHDAGTYFFKANLETGKTVETKFVPLDTISEDIISSWAKPEVEKAIELGIVPLSFRENYKRNITRSEFAKLGMYFLSVQYGYAGAPMLRYWSPAEESDNLDAAAFMNAYCAARTDRNGNPFRDKYDEADYVYHNSNVEINLPDLPFADMDGNSPDNTIDFVKRAYHIGIVNGISETEFNPAGTITRQEAAAQLMRIYKNYAEFNSAGNENKFSDDEQIADWAKEDVYNIHALGVMQGVAEDTFAPSDGYTIEQAIVTFWRLYDSAPVSRKNKNITPLLDYKFESEHYFDRMGGAYFSYFHETVRKEYEDFILVYGYWTEYKSRVRLENLCVFDKYGGIVCDVDEVIEWAVRSDEKVLTVVHRCGDTFRLYNKLNGTEKVYDKGVYKSEYDMERRELVNFERVE